MKIPYYLNSNGKVVRAMFQRRPFPVIDKAIQQARWQIMAQEDEAIFKILDDSLFEIVYATKDK